MTVDRSAGPRSQGAIQETAQALVARGETVEAVRLLDRFLAEFDGDWGMWLYFAGLCARLGKRDEAVAAYRACARQLEGDGHFARAKDALLSAMRLVPRDEALRREIDRVGRSSRRPQPQRERLAPPVVDPQETCLLMPAVEAPAPARLPDPRVHLTSVIPGRAKSKRPPPSPEVTDPYCPIFEILDAERAAPPPGPRGGMAARPTVNGRRA
ncbi:MAG: hypothetical protein Q8L48_26445 [Archangium sp.]|nr:hypothetical protein [Archangium sp.]